MSSPQALLVLLLATMIVLFASGRVRVETVALLGLAAAFALGLVPQEAVFSGFASPTVITVLEILLIIGVLGRSHVIDALGRYWPARQDRRLLVLSLCTLSAGVSVFMNNIGALALVIPLVLAVGARQGVPARALLMPVSFATLLGGLGSVIGTPTNLLVAQAVESLRPEPFGFFEIGLVGLPVAVLGLAYLAWAQPPGAAEPSEGALQPGEDRVVGLQSIVPPGSALIGRPLQVLSGPGIEVVDAVPAGRQRPANDLLRAGDLVFLAGAAGHVEAVIRQGLVALLPAFDPGAVAVEAVVMPDSIFVGSQIADLEPLYARDIVVDGLRPGDSRLAGPFAAQRLRIGDVLLLRGAPAALAAELEECGLMALAQQPRDPPEPASLLPVLLFAAGIALTAVTGLGPEIAFGLVVVALMLTGSLSLRRGLETMNWPILVMLGAMIPIGAAVETTGLARTLVEALTGLLPAANLPALIGAMVLLAATLTPFATNPSTFLMLAPVAAETARQYGVPAEPLLLAVGVGASLDFLTPFGHHNNTLVMGLGGYSFGDFLRLGGPLVLLAGAGTVFLLSLRFAG